MGRLIASAGPSCDPDTCTCRECDNYTDPSSTAVLAAEQAHDLPIPNPASALRINSIARGVQTQTLLNRLRASVLPDPSISPSSTSAIIQSEDETTTRSTTRLLPLSRIPMPRLPPGLQSDTTSPFPSDQANATTVTPLSRTTITISRSSNTRTSPYRASRLPAEPADYSSMLPPRLGTPIPGPEAREMAIVVGTSTVASISSPSASLSLHPRTVISGRESNDEQDAAALTSLGRRTLARTSETVERPRTSIGARWIDELDNPFGYAALNRAHSAIEGSRTALTQARDAIRNALLHTERLERIAAILRRQTPLATPATIDESMRQWNDERPDYDLERSLAELRQAGAELDRVIRAATVETGFIPSLTRPRDVAPPLPPLPAWDSAPTDIFRRDTSSAGASLALPSSEMPSSSSLTGPSLRQVFRHLESPQDTNDQNHARVRRSGSIIRQPVPYRPGTAQFDALAARLRRRSVSSMPHHPNLVNARNEAFSAAMRGGIEVEDSSSGQSAGLTLGELRQMRADMVGSVNSAMQGEEAASLSAEDSDDSPLLPDQNSRNLRRRGRGGWRRLDANGDEIEVDDELMFHSPTSLTGSPSGGLGWSWRPASAAADLADEEEKTAQRQDGWHLNERSRNASSGSRDNPRRFRFQGNREMVGR